jgi:transposase
MPVLSAIIVVVAVGATTVGWRTPMKTYRPWTPEQSYLLPPSPSDWLPEGHLVYFILDIVRELDLSSILRAVDAKDARGERPYSPVMMVTLLLYSYCVAVFSSRRIERATYEDVAFRVLTGGEHPHFTRIADFRRTHIDAFRGIFVATVKLCQGAGMVKLGLVALDGSKLQGNASKHKAMSYERMQRQERRLQEEIASLLARAEEADRSEDARFGEGQREEDLPEELRRREGRLAKIRAAKHALEQGALRTRAEQLNELADGQDRSATTHPDATERKRAATRAKKQREKVRELLGRTGGDDPPMGGAGTTSGGLATHRVQTTADGKPDGKAQYNFTDPESRIQERGGAFLQGYNCQAVVDAFGQVIVAQGVTNLQPDTSHFRPMLEQTAENCGQAPDVAAADAGFWSADNVVWGTEHEVEVYISTARAKHSASPGSMPGGDDAKSRMARKLATDPGRALYARRKTVVEPVFGQIKEVRGFRRFLLRGLRKVGGEWSLLAATHNLLKLFRQTTQAAPA